MTHKNIKRISSNDNLLKKIVVIVIGSIIAAYGITLAL